MENRATRFAKHWERMFGVRVKDLRQARGWTQGDLAQRLTAAGYPMHQTTVAKMEGGSRPTNVGEVAALAAIFGIPIGSVFSEVEDEDARTTAAMARLFDRWESARQESIRASKLRDEAFRELSRFVQEHHSEALEPFYERVRLWAEVEADAKSEAEVDAVQAIVLATAVPVQPFKDLEREALQALQVERDSKEATGDGQHQEEA